jgi:glycosyltransferase involved in cell wall biosynthesis
LALPAMERAHVPSMVGAMAVARPRLVLLVPEDWDFWSHRVDLALAAVRAGFDVFVATRVASHAARIRAAGLHVCPLRWLHRGVPGARDVAGIAEIVRLYRRLRPAVVHHVGVKPVVYGSWAARLARGPHVVNAIAGLGSSFIGTATGAGLLRATMKRVLRSALATSDSRVIFQNRDDLDYFKDAGILGDTPALIIPGVGVDLELFRPSPEPTGVPVVMLAARLVRDKGIVEFVSAARELRRRIEARFVLVGMVDDRNPTRISAAQIEAWQTEGVIEWWRHRDDMVRTLRAANLVVLPSYREGFPKVLLEAAASGRAIVATNVPGCREIVRHGENGYLVPARDVVGLAAAIEMLVQNPILRAEAGRRGRDLAVSEFSSGRITDHTILIYRELLSEQSMLAAHRQVAIFDQRS